jgi:hypothetical protein
MARARDPRPRFRQKESAQGIKRKPETIKHTMPQHAAGEREPITHVTPTGDTAASVEFVAASRRRDASHYNMQMFYLLSPTTDTTSSSRKQYNVYTKVILNALSLSPLALSLALALIYMLHSVFKCSIIREAAQVLDDHFSRMRALVAAVGMRLVGLRATESTIHVRAQRSPCHGQCA